MNAAVTLLSSRRAAITFAVTVFIMSVVQVLSTPLTALAGGVTDWGLVYSEPVIIALLVAGCAVQSGALLLSDRWPQLAVALTAGIYLGMVLWLGVPTWLVGMYLVIALATFLLATRATPAVSIVWAVGVSAVAVAILLWWLLAIGTEVHVAFGFVLAEAARLVMPIVGGAALGIWWAAQVNRVSLAREEAELAKQEHEVRVAAAEARERARIAQELHDVAGQHLAGLITLSDGALAIAPTQPAQALRLVREVRDEGRFAAASLAGALSDLRAAGAERQETTRDMQRVPELIDYWRQRGMLVSLDVKGELTDLPAVVSTTAYRSVQEALTNAAKHAAGATVDVRVQVEKTQLTVDVVNEATPGSSVNVPGLDLGWGLAGVKERVELLGGTLATSTTPSGGWRFSFTVPVTAAP